MKKLIILFGGILFVMAQSCDVLDKEPLDTISTEQYFSTASAQALEIYCNDLYPKLLSGHGDPGAYGFGMLEGDYQSDNILPWDANMVAFSQHTISTSDDNWKWENLRACNAFLEYYEQSPESEELKHQYAGEILFFRVMDYYTKVRRFGDVPWYDHVLNPGDEDLYKARDSRILVMENMVKDIDQAIEWLPTKAETGKVYRISKDAALALKARFCLFEGTYRRYHNIEGDTEYLQMAYEAAGELMKPEYGYALFTGSSPAKAYHELFIQADYNSNPEVILSREYDPGVGKGNNVTRMIGVGETPVGFSRDAIEDYLCATTGLPISLCGCEGHTHHTTLAAELNNRDPRLLQTVATPEPGDYTYQLNGQRPGIGKLLSGYSSSTGYPIAKFYDAENFTAEHNQGTLDAPIFRYAEILLIRAEAGAELGLDPELDKTVNALRDRVGFTHHLTTSPREDPKLVAEYPTIKGPNANLIREIRRERRVELMAEGYRYSDLMRWACGLRLNVPKLGVIVDDATFSAEDRAILEENLGYANTEITQEPALDVYTKRMSNPVPNFIEPKNYLFSIPTNQIGLNPNLTQNPGWEL